MKQSGFLFNIRTYILKYIYTIVILTLCFCLFASAASDEYILVSGYDYFTNLFDAQTELSSAIEIECFDSDLNLLATRTVRPYQYAYYDDLSGNVGLYLYASRVPSNTSQVNFSVPFPNVTNIADYVGSIIFKNFTLCSPVLPRAISLYFEYTTDNNVFSSKFITDLSSYSYQTFVDDSGWNLYQLDPVDISVDVPLDASIFNGLKVVIDTVSYYAWSSYGSRDCFFEFTQVNYIARNGYNAGLEMLIQNQIKTAEEITGAIEDLKGDLLDVPDFEFEAPPGATAEEDVVNTLTGQITDFFEQLNVDVGTVIDSPTGLSYIDPQHLAFVSAYIIDPIFNAGVFKPIITITFPIVFLLIIFGFAGLAGSFRSGGGKHD